MPVFLEVGPGQMLTSLTEQYLAGRGSVDRVALASLPHSSDAQPDRAFILNTLGNLWLAGVEPDWAGVHRHERRNRVTLPTYPFERQRYWHTPRLRSREKREAGPAETRADAQEMVSSDKAIMRGHGSAANSRSHLGAEYVAPSSPATVFPSSSTAQRSPRFQ